MPLTFTSELKGKVKCAQSLHCPTLSVRSLPETWTRRLLRSGATVRVIGILRYLASSFLWKSSSGTSLISVSMVPLLSTSSTTSTEKSPPPLGWKKSSEVK